MIITQLTYIGLLFVFAGACFYFGEKYRREAIGREPVENEQFRYQVKYIGDCGEEILWKDRIFVGAGEYSFGFGNGNRDNTINLDFVIDNMELGINEADKLKRVLQEEYGNWFCLTREHGRSHEVIIKPYRSPEEGIRWIYYRGDKHETGMFYDPEGKNFDDIAKCDPLHSEYTLELSTDGEHFGRGIIITLVHTSR